MSCTKKILLLAGLVSCTERLEAPAAGSQETTPAAAPVAELPSDSEPAATLQACAVPGEGCTCVEDAGEESCFPSFAGSAELLSSDLRAAMTGVSWKEGCPASLDELQLLRISHWDAQGAIAQGELVVAAAVAADLLQVFQRIYDGRFPIARMERIDLYGGDDDASMAANNSSAFNCRRVGGSSRWSRHAYGTAIDINPLWNPWVKGQRVEPPAGAEYADRAQVRSGMLVAGDAAVRAFDELGWGWGGRWTSSRDYQHFSQSGR